MANRARVSEKTEQAHIVQLLRSFGGRVFVLGTHRRSTDFHGTMQTPGLPDVIAFLPVRGHGQPTLSPGNWRQLHVECKAAGGRLRPEQVIFRELSESAGIAHVVGGMDAVIAWLINERFATPKQFPHYRVTAMEATPR